VDKIEFLLVQFDRNIFIIIYNIFLEILVFLMSFIVYLCSVIGRFFVQFVFRIQFVEL